MIIAPIPLGTANAVVLFCCSSRNDMSMLPVVLCMLTKLTGTYAYSTCWFLLGGKVGGVELSIACCRSDTPGEPRLDTVGGECLQCAGNLGGLLLLVTSGVCDLILYTYRYSKRQHHIHVHVCCMYICIHL